jgi:D-arabinose 1-dehydrogenase-like Zn-dependent alcohol dehydrogenase
VSRRKCSSLSTCRSQRDRPPAVLVGVEYAPINMNDLYVIQGAFPVRPSLPSVVAIEGVGRVLAVGSGVEHLKVGDQVLIPLYAFSWRERLVVPAVGLFSLPEAEPQQLAMLGINPPTASLLLDEAPDLKPGDWVVQNAANSGVGRSLIAIAKARGIKTINLVRRPELIPELQAYRSSLPARASRTRSRAVARSGSSKKSMLSMNSVEPPEAASSLNSSFAVPSNPISWPTPTSREEWSVEEIGR